MQNPRKLLSWDKLYKQCRLDSNRAAYRNANVVNDNPEKGLPQGIKLLHTLEGHSDAIGRIDWSNDGRLIASGSRDQTVRLWDVETGDPTQVLEGHSACVYSVAFNPVQPILASGSLDNMIRLWDVGSGQLLRTLEGHEDAVFRVAWSPNGEFLASGSADKSIKLWSATSGMVLASHVGHYAGVNDLAWSPDGLCLATGSYDQWIRFWNVDGGKLGWDRLLGEGHGHRAYVSGLSWSKGGVLASGSDDTTIAIWDTERRQLLLKCEGHTKGVNCVAFSADNQILASKARDGTVRLLRSDTWDLVAVLNEPSSEWWAAGLSFDPTQSRLATVGASTGDSGNARDQVIHLWKLDKDALLSSMAFSGSSAHHATARIVVVGNSGVGKTGLGWRLAHGAFKEHVSTHGQQFWVVGALGARRADGTECEAVLWDLAGQPDYRLTHALFLDDVDLALVLFDPTATPEPLNGVEYWLQQLYRNREGDARPSQDTTISEAFRCPTVLVAARCDVGAPRLSTEDLDAFCRMRGIAGYVRTSAAAGEGIDELLGLMRTLVAWDQKPATITTTTFKRIKDHLLGLKQSETNLRVIVGAQELREQLAEVDPKWRFSDEEMLAAVGHLENYGYVKRLRTSKGERRILLTPELLNNLAASFVLEARRNPRNLGALEEQRLFVESKRYIFPELVGLSATEQTILVDAVALLFIEHHVCFRETDPLMGASFLVFPELINLSRPQEEEKAPEEGVAYVIKGGVENVFASLVVLLGYTSTFTRVSHWKNNARYEFGDGSVCGFRQETEGLGELHFVLCFSSGAPLWVRRLFQSLFEGFLSGRSLVISQYEPVVCSNPICRRVLDRAVVRARIKEEIRFIFCNHCGARLEVPLQSSLGESNEQESAVKKNRYVADTRTLFEQAVLRVATYLHQEGIKAPECFISYAWGDPQHERWVEKSLATDLQKAGINVLLDKWENSRIAACLPRFVERVLSCDRVIVVGTPLYRKKYDNNESLRGSVVAGEGDLIGVRMIGSEARKETVMPLLVEGTLETALPPLLHGRVYADFRNEEAYFAVTFQLILSLCGLRRNHPAVADLSTLLEQESIKS